MPENEQRLRELERKFLKADQMAQAGDEQAKADAQLFASEIKRLRAEGGLVTPAQPESVQQTDQRAGAMAGQLDQLLSDQQFSELTGRGVSPQDIISRPDSTGGTHLMERPPMEASRDAVLQSVPRNEAIELPALAFEGATLGQGDRILDAAGQSALADGLNLRAQQGRENRPWWQTLGAEGLGGLATGTLSGVMTRNALRQAPKLIGGVSGAVYGEGQGDRGQVNVTNALAGGAMGGLGTAVFQAGLGSANALRRVGQGRQTPGQAANTQFGVRLSQGQATDDYNQRTWEYSAARGAQPGAQEEARAFFEQQREDVISAAEGLAGNRFANSSDAAGEFLEGTARRAGEAQNDITDAYNAARAYDASLTGDGVRAMQAGIIGSIRNDPGTQDIAFLIEGSPQMFRRTYPGASGALEAVRILERSIPDDAVGVQFDLIETARRSVNASVGNASTQADRRAAQAIKRGFDDYVEFAVRNAMFDGDEAFLDAFRNARGLHADFQRTFNVNDFYDDIIRRDSSPEEALRAVLGASKIGNRRQTREMIAGLREALGPNSDEFGALQEAAIKRLVRGSNLTRGGFSDRGYTNFLKNLDELLVGENQYVAAELFSPQQYQALRDFRNVLERIIPPEGSINRSNTQYEQQRELARSMLSDWRQRWQHRAGGRTILTIMEGVPIVQRFLSPEYANARRAQGAFGMQAGNQAPPTALPPGSRVATGQLGVSAENALLPDDGLRTQELQPPPR